MLTRARLLPFVVYALVALNIGALWMARGDYVSGWDLFGATFGALALGETGSFTGGLERVTAAFLAQKNRPVFTGGESYLHGLLPGLLDQAAPWLLWGNLVCLVIIVLILFWLAPRLPSRPWVLWACVLASPALVSQSIVGLPHLSSVAVPFGGAIGYCLTESRRRRSTLAGTLLDVIVFAAITFYAFNGYESGKTFWVIPIVAAVTLPHVPVVRRVVWIACAVVAARLAYETQAMTTVTALAAVPHEPRAFLAGLARIPRRYFIDWWIDFPALLVAALPSLLLLRADRLFWLATFFASLGLVSLSAFQFDGGFLSPHRFLLLIFVCALIVAVALSDRGVKGPVSALVVLLLVSGSVYTTWLTVRFVRTRPSDKARDYNLDRVYPLPYNHSSFENQLWRDRIHDAIRSVDLVRQGTEPHLFLYGFSALAEDGVNPQLFVSRVLLPLGYRRFTERVAFFDHDKDMFFGFPIHPVTALPEALAHTPVPFLLHVREPEYSAPSVVLKYLNRAVVTPVDLGLIGFRSYRVEAWAPPGPIPVRALDAAAATRVAARADALTDGFCLTRWAQEEVGHSPLRHWMAALPTHLETVLTEAASGNLTTHYAGVARRLVPAPNETVAQSGAAYFVGYLDNPTGGPLPARLALAADDEVALLLNGQTIVESLGWKPVARYDDVVLLPPGWNELQILYHKYWHPGGVHFESTDAAGAPLRWQCAADRR